MQARKTDVIWPTIRRPPDPECLCSRCAELIKYPEELLHHPGQLAGEYRYHRKCLNEAEQIALAASLRFHGSNLSPRHAPPWECPPPADAPAERQTEEPPAAKPPCVFEKLEDQLSSITYFPPADFYEKLVEQLEQIKRLPKPHCSFPFHDVVFQVPGLLEQVVRITGMASGHLIWTSEERWRLMFAACKKHAGKLVINYSPFNKRTNDLMKAAKEDSLTFQWLQKKKQAMALDFGTDYLRELDSIGDRLMQINGWADFAEVKIEAVVLDHEKSLVNNRTRTAIARKLTKIYAQCHAIITSPAMRVVWFKYGGCSEASQFGGWRSFEQMPFEGPEAVPCDNLFGCTLYHPLEVHHQRAILYETLAHAQAHGVDDLAPWVSLGWGWTRDNASPNRRRADESPYTTTVSCIMGNLLNRPRRNGIAKHVPLVVFWPEVGHSPAFWDHFMAYCRGAQNER